jgi:hypothetical protein
VSVRCKFERSLLIPYPSAGATASEGMAPRPSRRRKTIIEGAKIGRISQATKIAQAVRDTRLRLPDWQHSGQLLWPPPSRLDPSFFAPPERGDPRATSDEWWRAGAEAAAVEQERQQRQAVADEAARREFYAGR